MSFNGDAARSRFEEILDDDDDDDDDDEDDEEATNGAAGDDGDEGPNARGTYSKAYVMKHPEVGWVHRGQGRYLPAAKAKVVAAPTVSE